MQCGYNLTGVMIGGACPECGSQIDQSLYTAGIRTNGKAVTAMVLGICSIALCCCLGWILGIPGLIFGIIALNEVNTHAYSQGSRGMAVAGIWCSSIGLCLGVIHILMMLI